jgi:hypothetical protein
MSAPRLSFARSEELFARAREIVVGGTTQGKAPNTLLPGEYPIYAERVHFFKTGSDTTSPSAGLAGRK